MRSKRQRPARLLFMRARADLCPYCGEPVIANIVSNGVVYTDPAVITRSGEARKYFHLCNDHTACGRLLDWYEFIQGGPGPWNPTS